MNELRFRAADWTFYRREIAGSALGAAAVIAVLPARKAFAWISDPTPGSGLPHLAYAELGIIALAIGAALIVPAAIRMLRTAGTAWRRWRQFTPPAVVLDADGVHYQARRPAVVPWTDIEEILLDRSTAALRLAPGAALLEDGGFSVPRNRYLDIGPMSSAEAPRPAAFRFLQETAGLRPVAA